ncbi:hypothetical protein SLEP1_g720 [Rubroshorea leprosula]|uniref:Uncharacterized protein n=1 Tax=Rubroshorea leprosula TaxID=152421 RepID=A0AAV5HK79_9ROSI|nr:hypothetical protein SLEP1_g720 [Rubroshorea leprosula]
MAEVPSLVHFCIQSIRRELLLLGNELPSYVYELPPELFDSLVACLPPWGLEKLQTEMRVMNSNDDSTSDHYQERKRRRKMDFNASWKALFMLRWPERINCVQTDNWQQIYWETHLQDCLDEALELAMLPSFCGCVGEIKVSDNILKHIFHEESLLVSTCDVSKLSFHCQQFGSYARCLRLHNVLNIQESSQLLTNCKLQSLEVHRIRSEEHVNRLCKLLSQNRETLKSIEFLHCMLCPNSVNAICSSLLIRSLEKHQIQHLSIRSSRFLETTPASSAHAFASFLMSGRSLSSLKLQDNNLNSSSAQIIFTALLEASSDLSILNLSENYITGWLSGFNRRSSGFLSSSGIVNSLQSLRVLNLRGNNLHKEDADDLRYALIRMPSLEILDISENPFGDEGISRLIPYFVEVSGRGTPLVCLELEDSEISSVGVEQLLNTISEFERPLNSLSIAHNCLYSGVAPALGRFLSNIQVLNIEDIGLGPSGFEKLYEVLVENLKLVEINISKNRGGIATARFLSKLISCAPVLVRVNAAHNFMRDDSLTLMYSTLKEKRAHLKHLDLSGSLLIHTNHASMFAEFKHNGQPIVILPPSLASIIPYDDDP